MTEQNKIENIDISKEKYIIYIPHGLCEVRGIEEEDLGDIKLKTCTLKCLIEDIEIIVPLNKKNNKNIVPVIEKSAVDDALNILKETGNSPKLIWSKKAQEYEKSLNSGSIRQCLEIIRDLYKNTNNPNRSFTERQIYNKAYKRVVSEITVVIGKSEDHVTQKVDNILATYHETYQDQILNRITKEDEIDELMRFKNDQAM